MLAIVDSAAANTRVHIYHSQMNDFRFFFFFSDICPEVELLDYMVVLF